MGFKLRGAPNPIMVKELRSRMRGARAFVILTGVLLLLALISYALYRIVLASTRYSSAPLGPQIGQVLFGGLVFLELMMVCFLTPAVTAGAISGEREKQTYDMLVATPLSPASVLWGKLVSALSYVFLLIFAAVPMASLVFVFGGVSPRDMIKALVVLMVVTITLGVIGVFTSAWLGRTARATVLSYLAVLALLVGPFFVYILVGVLRQAEPPRWILIPNPISALFSAISSFSGMQSGFLGGVGMILSGNLGPLMGARWGGVPRPLYHYTLPLYGALSLGLYFLASRLVRPARRWRLRWRDVLIAIAVLALFGGAVAAVFLTTADRYEKVSILATPTSVPMAVPGVVEREVMVERVVPLPEPTQAPLPVSPLPTPDSEGPTPASAPSSSLTERDEVAIYAVVIRQIYTVDHTFGEPPNFPIVYLVRSTDDGIGAHKAPRLPSHVLSEEIQTAILERISDLPAEFVWVDDADEAPRDDRSTVLDGGAVFTLGNVHPQDDGSVVVSGSLYFSMLGGGGKTYLLRRMDGVWQIVGDTGGWIS